MRITRAGAGVGASAAVLYAAGAATGYPELILLASGCLGALAVAAGWVARGGARRLEATRTCTPARPSVGQTVTVSVRIENLDARPSPPMLAVDTVDGVAREFALPALPGLGGHTILYEFVAARRGRLRVGAVMAGRSDPLGLMNSARPVGQSDEIRVHPRRYPGMVPYLGGSRDGEGLSTGDPTEGGGAFHSLRDYRQGDPWRRIHWRATAKRGVPMVRQHLVVEDPYHVLVLDDSARAYGPDGFEDAVRIAATLAAAIRKAGFGLELRTCGGDGPVVMEPTMGAGDDTAALDLLCDAERFPGGTEPSSVVADMVSRAAAAAAVLGVIIGRWDEAALGRLLDSLAVAGRRFQAAYVIQVGVDQLPRVETSGVLFAQVADSEEFSRVWNRLARP